MTAMLHSYRYLDASLDPEFRFSMALEEGSSVSISFVISVRGKYGWMEAICICSSNIPETKLEESHRVRQYAGQDSGVPRDELPTRWGEKWEKRRWVSPREYAGCSSVEMCGLCNHAL